MGKPAEYDPINETEYLIKNHIIDAAKDKTLKHIVSSYDAKDDRIWPGQFGEGPKIVTFSPILHSSDIQLNNLLRKLLQISENTSNAPVEMEFAVTLSGNSKEKPYKFGFLQVRPMVVSNEVVEITDEEFTDSDTVIASDNALGNGILDNLQNIIYVKPDSFKAKNTKQIAKEIESLNKNLLEKGEKYILIGFGRWGTTDEWAGIPVDWSQISASKVIIEAGLENMMQEMSQASHFFHNVTSFQVLYYSIPFARRDNINWKWLKTLKTVAETEFVKHVKTPKPVLVKANGKKGRGIIKT